VVVREELAVRKRRLGTAGDNYETAVLEPRALALLSRLEERAAHYDTASF
jgi:hypothetical protein